MGQEADMFAVILLGLEVVVLLVMLAGFLIVHVGPESVRKQVADVYYHHIVRQRTLGGARHEKKDSG